MTEINGDSPAAPPAAANNAAGGHSPMNRPDVQKALEGLKNMGWANNEHSKKGKLFGVVLNIIMPIIPIVIGGIFMNDCPVEPMIPIWCVVNGSFTIISSFLELFVILRGDHHKKTASLVRLIHVFLPIWFIVGCVYTYRNYEPEYDAPVGGIIAGESYDYCNKILYQFTFWYLTAYFIAMLVGMFCCCCCCCCIITGGLAKIGISMNNKTDVENVTPAQMEVASEKA